MDSAIQPIARMRIGHPYLTAVLSKARTVPVHSFDAVAKNRVAGVSALWLESGNLLAAKRSHGADASGAAGGKPGCEQSGGGEQSRCDRECDWIQSANFVEHA